MKNKANLFLLSLPLFILCFCTASPAKKDIKSMHEAGQDFVQTNSNSIALLELFTSQGCSSCPPADRLLGTFASKENVIVLSYHVDYWDRLGWKDPFSSKLFTQRQTTYASALHADTYTPQLIINGQAEMIGSDENKITAAINKIVSAKAEVMLSIKTANVQNGNAVVNFNISGKTAAGVLNLALVQKTASTDVKAGENGGVTLKNYNVVRNFKTMDIVKQGDDMTSIEIPAAVDVKNLWVIIFLQNKVTLKIIAADQHSL